MLFLDVTHSRTGRHLKINADFIRRVDNNDGSVVFEMDGGDIIPVDNGWDDIQQQLNK